MKKLALAAAGALLVLGPMLLPGYVLTLDMVFTPAFALLHASDGLSNQLPLLFVLHVLNFFIAGWVIEKLVLLVLFFLLFYIPLRFLPLVSHNIVVRLFAAIFYAVNPFVYDRMLAGQWQHLYAYAMLPLFLYLLFIFSDAPSSNNALKLAGVLFAIGLFSTHFLLMAGLITVAWLIAASIGRKRTEILQLFKQSAITFAAFFLASSYWIIPALMRAHPLEQRFTAADFSAFAAAGHGALGVVQNLLMLCGFWGERELWSYYFLWPQDSTLFLIACGVFAVITVVGCAALLKRHEHRRKIVFLLAIALCALVFGTGAADTIFKPLNLFLYAHVPLWSGLRDSQKFIGLLALVYTIVAAAGIETMQEYAKAFLVVPVIIGMFVLGGFHGQLQSVWYPSSWVDAKTILDAARLQDSSIKILVLPWHGYMSLPFANNLIVSNPAKSYFGQDVIASQSVEVGDVYQQSSDELFHVVDKVIQNESTTNEEDIVKEFQTLHIRYILYVDDIPTDAFKYRFLQLLTLHKIIDKPELKLYEVSY